MVKKTTHRVAACLEVEQQLLVHVVTSQRNSRSLRRYTLRKTAFLSHLYIKTIILPRQARDKHRENSKKCRFPYRGRGQVAAAAQVGRVCGDRGGVTPKPAHHLGHRRATCAQKNRLVQMLSLFSLRSSRAGLDKLNGRQWIKSAKGLSLKRNARKRRRRFFAPNFWPCKLTPQV